MKNRRSRKLRRIFIKTPSNRSKIIYKKRAPSRVKCSICKKPLHGIKRLVDSKFRNLPKSQKRPRRIYAGNICSNCTKRILINKARENKE